MPSLIPGFEYDIFISYRQKDNKYDGWVTEFVDNLKKELEATFKEEISVYFDINPHDGLLETHDVDASLKDKLRCLICIPVISRTYCDPKSFAWEHEFKAFVEQASQDKFGLKIKLPHGNIASRVLPVLIHELDSEDIRLCESVIGGYLRGVEFIYKEPGVNRPLRSAEDSPGNNLNKTFYRNQVNKVANAVKEIISGLKTDPETLAKEKTLQREPFEEVKKEERFKVRKKPDKFPKQKLIISSIVVLVLILIAAIIAYPRIFKNRAVAEAENIYGDHQISESPVNRKEYYNAESNPMGNTVAVFIENSTYSSFVSLDGPVKDINLMIKALVNYQINNIIHKRDMSKTEMEKFFSIELRDLIRTNQVNSLLIWYAGHGKFINEVSYWIPVDARRDDEFTYFNTNALRASFETYFRYLNHFLLVTDACELSSGFYQAMNPDLKKRSCDDLKATHYKSSQVFSSAGYELQVIDSPFTTAFATALINNNKACISIEEIVTKVKVTEGNDIPSKPKFGKITGLEDEGGTFFFVTR